VKPVTLTVSHDEGSVWTIDPTTAAGVAADRVHAEGYGSTKPVADNATEAGRSQNRRVAREVAVQ